MRRMENRFRKWLHNTVGECVTFDEPLSKHTSFRIGGPADVFFVPETIEQLSDVLKWAFENDIPYMILGGGTNVLFKDSGYAGIVICLIRGFKTIERLETPSDPATVRISAMSGVRTQTLCRYAIENGLGDMNFALGIPGTIGGAIAMNAGTAKGSMQDVLVAINVLDATFELRTIGKTQLRFDYRKLFWSNDEENDGTPSPIIVGGIFELTLDDPDKIRSEAENILKRRKQTQPSEPWNAGCFFKNPVSGKSAGELIDLAGLKGRRVGDAKISERHANFIINEKRASAADILALKDIVQKTVQKMFNVSLEPEVKIVG